MSPIKRKSTGSDSAPKTPVVDPGETLRQELEATLGGASMPPYAAKVLDILQGVFLQPGSFMGVMEGFLGADKDMEIPLLLEKHFPAGADFDKSATIASLAASDTLAKLRPWMLATKAITGQKGYIEDETARVLISLILVQGFRTNSASTQGVEALSVEPVSQGLDKYYMLPMDGYAIPTASMGYVKGWTRAVCYLFACCLNGYGAKGGRKEGASYFV
jgi:hypothetical protein